MPNPSFFESQIDYKDFFNKLVVDAIFPETYNINYKYDPNECYPIFVKYEEKDFEKPTMSEDKKDDKLIGQIDMLDIRSFQLKTPTIGNVQPTDAQYVSTFEDTENTALIAHIYLMQNKENKNYLYVVEYPKNDKLKKVVEDYEALKFINKYQDIRKNVDALTEKENSAGCCCTIV